MTKIFEKIKDERYDEWCWEGDVPRYAVYYSGEIKHPKEDGDVNFTILISKGESRAPMITYKLLEDAQEKAAQLKTMYRHVVIFEAKSIVEVPVEFAKV